MKFKLIAALALAITATGCATTSDSEMVAVADVDYSKLVDSKYEVELVNGEVYVPIDGNRKPTMTFIEKEGQYRVSGNATCNRYNGSIKEDTDKFIVEPIMVTRMMCIGGGTVMEREFLDILGAGSDISVTGDTIKLESSVMSLTLKKQ